MTVGARTVRKGNKRHTMDSDIRSPASDDRQSRKRQKRRQKSQESHEESDAESVSSDHQRRRKHKNTAKEDLESDKRPPASDDRHGRTRRRHREKSQESIEQSVDQKPDIREQKLVFARGDLRWFKLTGRQQRPMPPTYRKSTLCEMIDVPFVLGNGVDDEICRNYAEDWYTASGLNDPNKSMTARQELKAWLKAWLKKVTRELVETGGVMREDGELKFADWLIQRKNDPNWDGSIKPPSTFTATRKNIIKDGCNYTAIERQELSSLLENLKYSSTATASMNPSLNQVAASKDGSQSLSEHRAQAALGLLPKELGATRDATRDTVAGETDSIANPVIEDQDTTRDSASGPVLGETEDIVEGQADGDPDTNTEPTRNEEQSVPGRLTKKAKGAAKEAAAVAKLMQEKERSSGFSGFENDL